MKDMRFFFYGTLLEGSDNPVARQAHAKLLGLGPATARGTLTAIPDPMGWYPAFLTGPGLVHGRIYAAAGDFDEADLARLDSYEDCHPDRPVESLYIRKSIDVTGADGGHCSAQAYIYNRALPNGARLIPDGNFNAWLERHRLDAYSGRHGT